MNCVCCKTKTNTFLFHNECKYSLYMLASDYRKQSRFKFNFLVNRIDIQQYLIVKVETNHRNQIGNSYATYCMLLISLKQFNVIIYCAKEVQATAEEEAISKAIFRAIFPAISIWCSATLWFAILASKIYEEKAYLCNNTFSVHFILSR